MTSRNETTGDMIVVGAEPDSELYDNGWDRIWGKKSVSTPEDYKPVTEEGKLAVRKILLDHLNCKTDNIVPHDAYKAVLHNSEEIMYICDVCTRIGCAECKRNVE